MHSVPNSSFADCSSNFQHHASACMHCSPAVLMLEGHSLCIGGHSSGDSLGLDIRQGIVSGRTGSMAPPPVY